MKSIVLGIVEGITEFLPISSTGHLIVFEELLGFQDSPKYIAAYSYIIQLGAVLAVIVLYRRKIIASFQDFFPKKEKGIWVRAYSQTGLKFWVTLAAACIPGFIVVIALGDAADTYLFNAVSVAIARILGGLAMILTERFCKKGKHQVQNGKWLSITTKQALVIGGFQCLSVIPGISRSASTIIGGWFAGLSTPSSAEFSFFLAIPVMTGMSILKLFQLGGFGAMNSLELVSLGIGFIISFAAALTVVKRFISYLQKKPMFPFALYRILFGALILILAMCHTVNFSSSVKTTRKTGGMRTP